MEEKIEIVERIKKLLEKRLDSIDLSILEKILELLEDNNFIFRYGDR